MQNSFNYIDKMESRNIPLTLEKAKEWYNSGSADLREVALQAYTEDELKNMHFSDIKSFKDVLKALNMNRIKVENELNRLDDMPNGEHLQAIYKLDLIRKALNPNWKPELNSGTIYYPWVRWYPANKAREAANSNGWLMDKTFKADGEKYTLVGGCCSVCDGGLGYFGCGYGIASVHLGLLCCETKEIAIHMSKYFSKEIFEACYAQHQNYE